MNITTAYTDRTSRDEWRSTQHRATCQRRPSAIRVMYGDPLYRSGPVSAESQLPGLNRSCAAPMCSTASPSPTGARRIRYMRTTKGRK